MAKSPVVWHRLENSTPVIGPTPWTNVGSPTYGTGKFGNGINGQASTYIKASYSIVTYPTDNITFDFYYKPDNASGAATRTIIDIYDSATNSYIEVRCLAGSNQVQSVVRQSGTFKVIYVHGLTFSAGELMHIGCSFSSSATATNRVKFYKNGAAQSLVSSSTDTTWSLTGSGYEIAIGGSLRSGAEDAEGIVDNYKLFDYVKTSFNDRHSERGFIDDRLGII